jgi:hypothetical protein
MNIAWRVTRRDQPQMLSYIGLRITGPASAVGLAFTMVTARVFPFSGMASAMRATIRPAQVGPRQDGGD